MNSRAECPRPDWSDDHLESSFPAEIKAAYFDDRLGAWVLSRYADVLAAFRSPCLAPTSASSGHNEALTDESALLKMRAETKAALSLRQLHKWQKKLASESNALSQILPTDRTVDLVEEFARPLCLLLALMVTGADPRDAKRLFKLAWYVSAAAADPYDAKARTMAARANTRLRGRFHLGPEVLRDSSFVALSHTMPCLLANAWFALLHHPGQWARLHVQPDLIVQAMEELLRYAGLTRLLFRKALEDTELNGIHLRKGDRVILRVLMANRDPQRFLDPNSIDLTRHSQGQLAFGAGSHACVGANLIRMGAITITRPLIERFARAELAGPVKWRDGSVFRAPIALPVRLQETIS